MKYIISLPLALLFCLPLWASGIMTNQGLFFTNKGDCNFTTYSIYDKFSFEKKGKIRSFDNSCVVSFTKEEFYSSFQFCSQQPKAPYNIHQEQHCQIWTEGKDEVSFYNPQKNTMCLFTCLTREK